MTIFKPIESIGSVIASLSSSVTVLSLDDEYYTAAEIPIYKEYFLEGNSLELYTAFYGEGNDVQCRVMLNDIIIREFIADTGSEFGTNGYLTIAPKGNGLLLLGKQDGLFNYIMYEQGLAYYQAIDWAKENTIKLQIKNNTVLYCYRLAAMGVPVEIAYNPRDFKLPEQPSSEYKYETVVFAEDYTQGEQPEDWTRVFFGGVFTVGEDALEYTSDYIAKPTPLKWDNKDYTDADMITKFKIRERYGTSFNDETQLGMIARGSGTNDNDMSAYTVVIDWDHQVFLYKYVNGNGNILVPSSNYQSWALDITYNIRFLVQGTELKCKIWEDGTDEPEAWQMEVIDSDVTEGWNGIYGYPVSPSFDFPFLFYEYKIRKL